MIKIDRYLNHNKIATNHEEGVCIWYDCVLCYLTTDVGRKPPLACLWDTFNAGHFIQVIGSEYVLSCFLNKWWPSLLTPICVTRLPCVNTMRNVGLGGYNGTWHQRYVICFLCGYHWIFVGNYPTFHQQYISVCKHNHRYDQQHLMGQIRLIIYSLFLHLTVSSETYVRHRSGSQLIPAMVCHFLCTNSLSESFIDNWTWQLNTQTFNWILGNQLQWNIEWKHNNFLPMENVIGEYRPFFHG